jgi:hypothetical protein
MFYFVEMGLVLTYGQQVWDDERNTSVLIATNIIAILILLADMLLQLNCGYLYRGMIVMDDRRIVTSYMRGFAVPDLISVLILIICPFISAYECNFAKLWFILKVCRLFQIDNYYLRKLNIYRTIKAIYVIFKVIVIIFLLSHAIGLIFYAIDLHLYNINAYSSQSCNYQCISRLLAIQCHSILTHFRAELLTAVRLYTLLGHQHNHNDLLWRHSSQQPHRGCLLPHLFLFRIYRLRLCCQPNH